MADNTNTITVKNLVTKVNDIREDMDHLKKLNAVMQSDAPIHDGAMHLMEKNCGLKYDPIFILNAAENIMSEYAGMLERIMREATLPWPPSIRGEEKP